MVIFLNIYYKLGYFSYIYLDFIYNMCIIYGVIWKKLKFMVVVVFEEKSVGILWTSWKSLFKDGLNENIVTLW